MSEVELVAQHDSAQKKHKKKKRRRDDEEQGRVDEDESGRKKSKKRRAESEDGLPTVDTNAIEESSVVKERKKKKKEKEKKEQASDIVRDETIAEGVEANPAPKKKEKRKRDNADQDVSGERVVELGEDIGDTRERKKKKKRHEAPPVITQEEAATTATVSPHDTIDPPPKKKKTKKDKEMSSAAPTEQPPTQPPSDSLFPLANYTAYPPYFPGAQPNTSSVFPTLNNLPFSDLAMGSNEDVLNALQNLDITKIAGVLKTLTDAADAANIPLATIGTPSTNMQHVPPVASGSGSASTNPRKKHRRTLEVLPPSGSSSSANPDHAHLLANKWMSATKLGELVASEGLVYKKGKFSAIEIKQINDAIEEYRITKGLSEQDINAIIFPADDKTKDAAFWSTITSALTLRPIIAVYHYVRRARHPMKGQGKWQPEEDARLIQAVTSLGQQWEKVAHLVGRMSSDCRDRYRNHIVNRETRVFGTWSSAEEEELTRIVLDMQKGKNFDNDIFWTKVSAKMGGTRTRQQCRIKWTDTLAKKHKADGQSSRWSSRDAFILIHKIDSLNVRDDTEIDWKTIPDSEFHWSAHVLQRRWLTMKKGVKGFEDMTHTEIMDILRAKNAEIPNAKVVKSSKFVLDSDDEGSRPGSSTALGTLAGQRGENEDDSE